MIKPNYYTYKEYIPGIIFNTQEMKCIGLRKLFEQNLNLNFISRKKSLNPYKKRLFDSKFFI